MLALGNGIPLVAEGKEYSERLPDYRRDIAPKLATAFADG
jgi:hypothetical protein